MIPTYITHVFRGFLAACCMLLLAACSSKDSGSEVTIDVVSSQKLAPAEWTFKANSNLAITSYQWSFRSANIAIDNSQFENSQYRGEEVSFIFPEVGTYRVRLDYQTGEGAEAQIRQVEGSVTIAGGRIEGTITAAVNTLVDIDTRELAEPAGNNNSFEEAQILASKVNLSGVVDADDQVDIYQVRLQQSQRLAVQVADFFTIEGINTEQFDILEVALFSTNDRVDPVLVQQTESETGRFLAPLLIPADGDYFIKITAVNPFKTITTRSHGIYSLAISPASAAAAGDFVLGEVNILLKPNRQYAAQGMSTKADLGRLKTLSLDDARAFMASAGIATSAFTNSANLSSSNSSAVNSTMSHEEQQRWQVLQAVEILSEHDDIEIAEPNWKRYAAANASSQAFNVQPSSSSLNDPFATAQWHYDIINVPQAWQSLSSSITSAGGSPDSQYGDKDVVVAVLDTGVLVNHPDLIDSIISDKGHDFFVGERGVGLPGGDDPGDKAINNGTRSSFHGTHVAGTIAASANNGIGGSGVAPNVTIMPVRVLGEGGGSVADILAGVCYAAGLNESNGPGKDICNNSISAPVAAGIINLSLGGSDACNIEQVVYNAVAELGIIIIAAAGNEATSKAFYPAAYNNVISVAAVSQDKVQTTYSNFASPAAGSKIDVAAPGGDFSVDSGIVSTLGDDSRGAIEASYGALQGTSMAAPHVAGVAALMKSARPNLTQQDFLAYLRDGDLTQDIGATGLDNLYGYGLINAEKAVLAVLGPLPDKIISSNNQLFFNISINSLSFDISATNGVTQEQVGELTVTINGADNRSGGSWLSVRSEAEPSSFNSVAWGTNNLVVDRTGLPEGRYQADVIINSGSYGSLTVKVTLQVGNPDVSANAGVQYVLLVATDAVAENGVFPTEAGSSALIANDGKYLYQVNGIKKGRYFVSSGSDLDFDNLICDAGESCGQYPTLEKPIEVVISEDEPLQQVNMTVNYLSTDIQSFNLGSGEKQRNTPVFRKTQIKDSVKNKVESNAKTNVKSIVSPERTDAPSD